MKVTYQTCCGVDVHKKFLVATIVKTTGGVDIPLYMLEDYEYKDDVDAIIVTPVFYYDEIKKDLLEKGVPGKKDCIIGKDHKIGNRKMR